MVISVSKHEQNFNFHCIRETSFQVQDIWKNESFQELTFKIFKNCKHNGYFDRQQVRSIDQNLFFFKLKLLIFNQ